MTNLNKIKDALLTVTSEVYHFKAVGVSDKYIVWAEDGQAAALWADGKMQQQAITGTIDYFTTVENDTNVAAIQNALNGVCAWRLNSIQFEDETGLIHYEWIFEVWRHG